MSKNVISLERFSDFHDEVRGVEIRSHLNLPEYVPTSEAQVDIGRIATVSRIGRLESVNFKLFDGESGGGSATIAGVNPDGSAVAAKVRSRSVARASSELDECGDETESFIPKGVAVIKINSSHPDMDDQPLRSIKPWARLLDMSIREGVTDSVYDQLIKSNQGSRYGELAGTLIRVGLLAKISEFDLVESFAVSASLTVTGVWNRVISDNDPERKIIPGFAIDRYAVARSILATRKIVKPT